MNTYNFTIGIIGVGAVGVSMISHLVSDFKKTGIKKVKIIAFEGRKQIGPGLAYQPDDDSLILNRTAANMSVFPSDLEHFNKWLIKNGYPLDVKDKYLPRHIFGKYLQSTLQESIAEAYKNGNEVIIIPKAVEQVITHKKGYQLIIENQKILVNRMVLCTGNLPSSHYHHLLGEKKYHHSPYPINKFTRGLNFTDSIGIIGSRLSAIDTIIWLKNRGHKGKITMLSRNGYLPSVQFSQKIKNKPLLYCTKERIQFLSSKSDNGNLSYKLVLRLVLKELSYRCGYRFSIKYQKPSNVDSVKIFHRDLRKDGKTKNDWQVAFMDLNAVICDLWHALSHKDKVRFRKLDFSRFMSLRVPIPEQNAVKMADLFNSGQLTMQSGLESVHHSQGSFIAKHHKLVNKKFDVIINCTGADNDITKIDVPLFNSLLDADLIIADPLGGVKVDFHTNEAFNSNGKLGTGIYVIGNLTTGTHLFCSVLEINTRHCKRVSSELCEIITLEGIIKKETHKTVSSL